MSNADHKQHRDAHSNPPRATDAEDERWVGEGGGSAHSTHGAGNDGRDQAKAAETKPEPGEPKVKAQASIPGVEMANEEGGDDNDSAVVNRTDVKGKPIDPA